MSSHCKIRTASPLHLFSRRRQSRKLSLTRKQSPSQVPLQDPDLACAELGLQIPGDVSVAGFGDHPISRLLDPPLTSTIWDVSHVARLAVGFLR